MADTVRNIMENMIPELQDLEARGYFTKKEIREIVKRRSDFEYLLKRKAARRGDFLRCHALRLASAKTFPLVAHASSFSWPSRSSSDLICKDVFILLC